MPANGGNGFGLLNSSTPPRQGESERLPLQTHTHAIHLITLLGGAKPLIND